MSGPTKIPEEQLRAALKGVEGTAFTRSQLNEDLQRLLTIHLDAGYLNAKVGPAEVNYNRASNAVAIRVPVESGSVFSARVEGYEIKPKKLREALPLLREGGVDETSLTQGAQRLRRFLQEEGYFLPRSKRLLYLIHPATRQSLLSKQFRTSATVSLDHD